MKLKNNEGKLFSNKLTLVSVLFLIVQTIGAIIAIIHKIPSITVGHQGDPNEIFQDFMFGYGTELSAPLPVLLVLVLFLWLSQRQNNWGTIGLAGMILFGTVFILYSLMNPPFDFRIYDAPSIGVYYATIIALGLLLPILSIILMILILFFAIHSLTIKKLRR